jgi:hypothetical protein
VLEAIGRREHAIDVYTRGLAAAEQSGDDHALGELRSARDGLQRG